MVQRMKAEPASPDHKVPSQSKTATRGESWWTAAWKSAVVRVMAVGAAGVWVAVIEVRCAKAAALVPFQFYSVSLNFT
jgi:hypothetical protein